MHAYIFCDRERRRQRAIEVARACRLRRALPNPWYETNPHRAEGVAEPPLVKAPRIGYFGRIGDFSRFVRIFDSQDVENRLYNKKTAKIGLFRPIFVCFYAISGY